jgi:hypothetical protein
MDKLPIEQLKGVAPERDFRVSGSRPFRKKNTQSRFGDGILFLSNGKRARINKTREKGVGATTRPRTTAILSLLSPAPRVFVRAVD